MISENTRFSFHCYSDPSDKRTVLDFRRKVIRELKKIKLAWPGLNYTTPPGVLILHPSTPVILPGQQLSLRNSPQVALLGSRVAPDAPASLLGCLHH